MKQILDAVKDFGKATVSTTYDAAATSVVVSTGHGAKFPDPASMGPFYLVWWNSTDYADPSDDPNVEICLCIARATDTLTIIRAQSGTAASTKNTSAKTYRLILGPTAALVTSLQQRLMDSALNNDMLLHYN